MATWIAYCDGSGTHAESTFVTAGIVLATTNTWKKLQPRWLGVLRTYGLNRYHASDFNNSKGDFERLTRESQLLCHVELIATLSRVNLQFVTHSIRRSEFELALREMPQVQRIEPYDYLLEVGILGIKNWGEKKGLNATIDVVIESGERHGSNVFKILRKACCKGVLGKILHISISTKDDCLPLQIADLIAYEGYKNVNRHVTRPYREERQSLTAIIEGNPLKPILHGYISAKYWLENTHANLVKRSTDENPSVP